MTTPSLLQRCLLPLQARARSAAASAEQARGALMAEYGILIFFVGIAGFGILVLFGEEVWELFFTTESEFDTSRQIPPAPD